jgi:hypothetical protein
VLGKIGADSIHLHVPDGVLDYLVLSPQTEETVKIQLFESVQRWWRIPRRFWSKHPQTGAESDVERLPCPLVMRVLDHSR